MSNENENRNITLIQHYKRDYSKVAHKLAKYHGRNYPWTRGPLPLPPLILLKKNIIIIYICVYMCVLILAILFYKITFYFLLTISLILLRVMLYS